MPETPSAPTSDASGSDDLVVIERRSPRVVHVVLNRPDRRNALTGPLADRLAHVVEDLNTDTELNVIVVRGAGDAFCSGLDLKEFAADPRPPWVATFAASWQRVHRALFESPHVIVGALQRAAVNGGASLAMACDFLVAGDEAFLQVGEIQQGMAAPMNMAWLSLRFPESTIARIALLGDRIAGPELRRLGVAYSSVPDPEVLAEVDRLVERLAAHDPDGVVRIKRSMRATSFAGSAEDWLAVVLDADPLRTATARPVAAIDG